MVSRGDCDAAVSRQRLLDTDEAVDAIVAPFKDNPDKALVVRYIGQLVCDGLAAWRTLDGGEIEVRFASGETYSLGETTILRLA